MVHGIVGDVEIMESPEKSGVKILVKDDSGELWEFELDPDYYNQVIKQIDSQIPEERSENNLLKINIDYSPEKVWNIKKA